MFLLGATFKCPTAHIYSQTQRPGNHQARPAGPASLTSCRVQEKYTLYKDSTLSLPEKGVVRRGILMGANVRKWHGCTLEADGPRSPSGSTETMAAAAAAAAAAMAMVGLLLIGLRLLWQLPVKERQKVSMGQIVPMCD